MFLKIAGLILAGYTLVFGLFCVVMLHSGIAIVDVKNHRDGSHFFVPIPMALGNVGVALLPSNAFADMQRQIGPHKEILNAAIEELRNCPDGPLVQVQNKRENVLIEKKGDNLIVNVQDRHEDVYIRVPLSGTQHLVTQLLAER